ncbi:ABC transporter substrate-binding protein [Kineococcus gynurae]|uniref:ABC transporter substrate-binding protein n=1 Tax=Kineococcus gynurae TaxID=452979 RepID=A0ABV5LVU1_9ACTN
MGITRRSLLLGGAAAVGLPGALAGCSIADDGSGSGGSGGSGSALTMRIWDQTLQPAVQKSIDGFKAANSGVDVRVELVPWASYFDRLPADVAGGTLPDVLWTNSSNFGTYVDAGTFVDVGAELGEATSGWQSSVVEQYTRSGTLWGVPQLSDAIGLFYNRDLTTAAGVDPATLAWGGTMDTFLPAAQALTVTGGARTQYGFNAAYDLQAIYYNFVGSNGGQWQGEGDRYVFADDERSVEAIQYVVDLINRYRVAPSAADTNTNTDFSRDQFTQGNMALFQSGTYNLKNVADGAQFDWALAPGLTGPAGRVLVTNGIVAVGNAKSSRLDETKELLRWLGTEEGANPIGAEGAAFPAVTAAQQGFLDYWKGQGVDVQPFLDAAAAEKTMGAPRGPKAQIGSTAAEPALQEVFAGRLPVAEGLKQAQDAANAAIEA